MSAFDWGVVVILLLSTVMAAAQGLFFEIFSLVGTVVGFLLACWQYQHAAAWFAPFVSAPWVASAAGFLAIFLATVLFGGILGRIVRWGIAHAGLKWFDRVLGGFFGLLRGLALVTATVVAVAAFSPNAQVLRQSTSAPLFLLLGRAASWLGPPGLREAYKQANLRLGKAREAAVPPAATSGSAQPR